MYRKTVYFILLSKYSTQTVEFLFMYQQIAIFVLSERLRLLVSNSGSVCYRIWKNVTEIICKKSYRKSNMEKKLPNMEYGKSYRIWNIENSYRIWKTSYRIWNMKKVTEYGYGKKVTEYENNYQTWNMKKVTEYGRRKYWLQTNPNGNKSWRNTSVSPEGHWYAEKKVNKSTPKDGYQLRKIC